MVDVQPPHLFRDYQFVPHLVFLPILPLVGCFSFFIGTSKELFKQMKFKQVHLANWGYFWYVY